MRFRPCRRGADMGQSPLRRCGVVGRAVFATPFVYQMGGYRYMDFVRVVLPLNLLTFVVAILAIERYFPF